MEAIVYRQLNKESFCDETFYTVLYSLFFLGGGEMKKEERAREKQKKEEAKEEERERNKI